MAPRSALLPAILLSMLSLPVSAAEGPQLTLAMDQARVLKVPRPATTVIVGNPAIMDVTVQDATTMVMTGRAFGVTNLIILDEAGQPMVDETVGVTASETGTVRIYRQAERQTFACMPECQPTATIGDADMSFGQAIGQFTQRGSLATSAMAR